MGCDIHIYIEYEQFDRMESLAWGQIHVDRSYVLFNALAGVRGNDDSIPPIYPPRGLPEDVSWEAEKDSKDDGHTLSWLTLSEIEEVTLGLENMPIQLKAVVGALKGLEGHNARMVFWFDN